MDYIKKWIVYSEHSGNHIISLCDDGTYACDCIGWIRHYPRINCKHINHVIITKPTPVDKENWDALKGKKKQVKKVLDFFAKINANEQKING